MKKLLILALVLGFTASCDAQVTEKDTIANNNTQNAQKPNEQWTVNKEVDENGNVIRYDSIYSWSSSGNDQLMMRGMDMDSIMRAFTNQFHQGMPAGQDSFFEQFFNGNTAGSGDFFSSFFAQDSISGNATINSLHQQMEAMRQQLMQDMRQPLIPAAPEEPKQEEKSDKKSL